MRPSIPTAVLLDATAMIVAERGFGGVRMDAVAARAGVAKGVPYGRFEGKEALLRAMIDREFVLSMRRALELVEADPEGGRLSRMWIHAVSALHDRPALVRLYTDPDSPLGALAAERSGRLAGRAGLGADFLRRLQGLGLVDPGLDPDALAANLALWNLALATASPADLDVLLSGMGDLLARGADTGSGDAGAGVTAFAALVESLVSERSPA